MSTLPRHKRKNSSLKQRTEFRKYTTKYEKANAAEKLAEINRLKAELDKYLGKLPPLLPSVTTAIKQMSNSYHVVRLKKLVDFLIAVAVQKPKQRFKPLKNLLPPAQLIELLTYRLNKSKRKIEKLFKKGTPGYAILHKKKVLHKEFLRFF